MRTSRPVRLLIAYEGTGFHGWAAQPGGVRTVQGVLQEALGRVLGEAPALSTAGRTDAGVHASGQVASFTARSDLDLSRVQRAVNAMLAPEVVVLAARRAPPGFDARRSATRREYVYRIDTGPWPDPFTARFVWHRPGRLAPGPMRAAAGHLLGTHDFASFCRRPQSGGTVRTLDRLTVTVAGERVQIRAAARSFLHQMVRSLVGALVAAGSGRVDATDLPAILRARDRAAAPPVAPPHGLTLWRVTYRRRAGTGDRGTVADL